ncbi:MAG: ABC transporter ATP-binding protein [Candidatus Omnitrophica bacterium]|nr:ABC transporter ATP-binding protein [Candidatus Omnitrophota bacterium]
METVLQVNDLGVSFRGAKRSVSILSGMELEIAKGEALALVGESGCGKTMTALSVARLLPKNAILEQGKINLSGIDLVLLSEKEMENIRGIKIGLVFQEPSAYLNPVFTIGNQIEEGIKGSFSRREKREKTFAILKEVGLEGKHYWYYPHQLSGGMQQRSLIAMALVNHPSLLIADEPTTSLDVTTAMQIVTLMKTLREKHHLAVLFITHDIALARFFATRIAVMYAGTIVETGPAEKIFNQPQHPYTQGLIGCLPERYKPKATIETIPGSVPDFQNLPSGCPFHPRCSYTQKICTTEEPDFTLVDSTQVRCFRYGTAVRDKKCQ